MRKSREILILSCDFYVKFMRCGDIMVSALEVGCEGLGSSKGLAGLLSTLLTLLRIVGRPDKIPREVPTGIYVGLAFLSGDGEKGTEGRY